MGVFVRLHYGVFLAGFRFFTGESLVEGRFYGLRLLGTLKLVLTVNQLLEKLRELCKSLVCKVLDVLLHFFHGLFDLFLHLLCNVFDRFFHGILDFFLFDFYIWGFCGLDNLRLNFFTHVRFL